MSQQPATLLARVDLLSERKKVLSALDGFTEAAQQYLEVLTAFDEIDLGGIDDEQDRWRE